MPNEAEKLVIAAQYFVQFVNERTDNSEKASLKDYSDWLNAQLDKAIAEKTAELEELNKKKK